MIAGELVRLRALDVDADAETFRRWLGDAETTRYLGTKYPRSLEGIRRRLGEWAPMSFSSGRFAVERLSDGLLVGFAALRDATPEVRDAELDLIVGEKSAWGAGIGTDTMRTLCRFGFEQMNLHRIHLYVFTENAPAIAIYRKIGFVEEGLIRDAFYKRGAWHDCVFMGLLRGELR